MPSRKIRPNNLRLRRLTILKLTSGTAAPVNTLLISRKKTARTAISPNKFAAQSLKKSPSPATHTM